MTYQTKDQLSEQFRAIYRAFPDWLPQNVKRLKWSTITATPQRNSLGFSCDPRPETGKLVHLDDTLLILKVKPSQYCLMDAKLLPKDATLVVGSKITIEPYRRKSLEDGLPLDAARPSERGTAVMIIGDNRTRLPDRPREDGYLKDMADVLEAMPMPDRYRTISNALADWKATDFIWISEDSTLTYELHFTMAAPYYSGPVTIIYDRGADTYSLRHHDPLDLMMTGTNPSVVEHTDIHFEEIANHLSTLGGDHTTWCLVNVVPASSRKAA